MKLHEEFKEYESLWKEAAELEEAAELDPVSKILKETSDIELEYNGFSIEDVEDRFDPTSDYGHYQRISTSNYDDFTYTVEAWEVFKVLRDDIIPFYADKVPSHEKLEEYKKLMQAWETSTEETEEATGDAMELYLADNLEYFVEIFERQLKAFYREEAEEWAADHQW